ncbi:hypothetical protein LSAT2_029110 [Lamellibrachia satsuma]|nr:hypothetical protein LSAT2_029110 [Lamellibrachia satsuma]
MLEKVCSVQLRSTGFTDSLNTPGDTMRIVAVFTFCSTVLSTFCLGGFKADSSGCQICECVQPSNDVISDSGGVTCQEETCFMECRQGFAKDDNGCTLCECAERDDDNEDRELQSIHVSINFTHDEVEYIELAAFKRTLSEVLARLLETREDFIRDIEARKLEFRPRPDPDRECLAQARPGPQVSGASPAHTRGPKMGPAQARPGPSPLCLNCVQPRPGPGPQTTSERTTAKVERTDGTKIRVHFRLMGRSSEALATAVDLMTLEIKQGDGDTTVTYANTVFVADSVTSIRGDTDSPPTGVWLMETWQQVALVAVAAVVLVAVLGVIVILVVKQKRQRRPNENKKSGSNAAYKKAPANPEPINKIYLDHVYSA